MNKIILVAAAALASCAALAAPYTQQDSDNLDTAVGGAIMLKRAMKNPASFDLVSVYLVNGKTFCYRYRGTNSFNAIITELFVINAKLKGTDEKTWQQNCIPGTGAFSDLTGQVKISMKLRAV